MHGVVFRGNRELDLVTFDDPIPRPTEAVIEVKASGLCGSDLKFYRAAPGAAFEALGIKSPRELGLDEDADIIAGHEPCGVVAAVGADVDPRFVRVGDRVMVHHYDGCGFCEHCRTGWTQMCKRGLRIFGATAHGSHADYMRVAADTLVWLPDELSYSAGAAIACGTGTAFAALVRMSVTAQDTVAVFGQGPVGQSTVQLAAAMGAHVIAVDIERTRLERAHEFGAHHTIDSSTTDPIEAIREITHGKGVTRALDASGAPAARQAAARCSAPWAIVGFVGEGGEVTLDVSPDLIRKQLTIIGSYTFSKVGQSDCARFVVEHDVDVERVFTDEWPLEDAELAYREFDKQKGGKAVLKP